MGGDRLEQLMINAGFVDVKATKFKVEIGDWGPGLFPNRAISFVDRKKHKVARICVNVWSAAIHTFAEQLTQQFPNDEERSEFADSASADITNPAYHLYCNMYLIIETLLIHRYLVIGRKPGVKK